MFGHFICDIFHISQQPRQFIRKSTWNFLWKWLFCL